MSTANSNLVRRVYLDDEDPSIIYRGPWTRYKNDFKDYQAFGTVFKGSQHRLSGESGSLIFRFKGTGSMAIFGTSNPLNNSGIYDPSYSCKLDGVNVPAEKPLGLPINLWPLCGTNATDAGDHVFELAASSDEGDFYVDQITYTPARASPPEGPNTVAIDQDDLAVRFLEGSWNADVGGMATTEAGAKMSVTFTGTSARFIGSVPLKQPQENSTATYSIDGGTRVTFDVPGLYGALLPRFGQPFFELKDLGPGTHELIVTYNGAAAPLMFDHLEVEGGDIFQSALTRQVPGGGGGGKKTPIGAIVGGVVGGVVVLAILVILAFYWMKKRKQKKQAATNTATPRPPIQPHSPLNSMYEVKPLVMEGQSPPTSFQSMPSTVTGDSSLAQHTMQPMQPMPYMGHHQNFSTSSHPSSFPSNTNSRPTTDYQNHVVGPLAPARMSVAYTQQGPGYSRPPEPMA